MSVPNQHPAHTKGPWKTTNGTNCIYVENQTGQTIARVLDTAQGVIDAAHIVRCVNAHDAMVAALRAVIDWEDGLTSGKSDRHDMMIYQARAALKLAEGGAA